MAFCDKLIAWLHNLPHLNFKLKIIKEQFNVDLGGSYLQSLIVFAGISLLFFILLLVCITITWICQCCFKKKEQVRSHRNIRRLSTTLFLLSVVCFSFLGACLYGNEYTNKSVTTAANALGDFNQNLYLSIEQVHKLNNTQTEASKNVNSLISLIEEKSKSNPEINQTKLRELDSSLTFLSDKIDEIKNQLQAIGQLFSIVKILDRFSFYGNRFEFERWILCLTLLCIMITVLFSGVIAFCRQSRKGSITFSALGIVIFIVSWLLFCFDFPITVAYADFCYNGRPFIRSKVNDAVIQIVEFYQDCTPTFTHEDLPPNIPIAEIARYYSKIQENQQNIELLLYSLFNQTKEIDNINRLITLDIFNSFKSIGALESTLSCFNIHNDAKTMYDSFCKHGFLGSAIMTGSFFLLGIFLFILLILVSKSWYIFVRLPTDYVEVGDDDHFSPRGQDAMPENVYDTNVFNPRARQFGGMVDTNGSILNGITEMIDNGHLNNHKKNSGAPAHLKNNGTESLQANAMTGTWLRNNGNLASAPPASNTITSQHRNSGNYYRLSNSNPYRNHYHQPNTEFQEQIDI